MTSQEFAAAVAGHRFLTGLSEAHLASIAACAAPGSAAAGEVLFREGNAADACYLILSGRVAIEIHAPRRGTVLVQTLGAGDVGGWSWLTPPYVWQFDARALEPVQAIRLDGVELRRRLEQDHELGYQVLKRLVEVIGGRLSATRLQLLDVFK
jgi:CRP-like cAMP-binding protein